MSRGELIYALLGLYLLLHVIAIYRDFRRTRAVAQIKPLAASVRKIETSMLELQNDRVQLATYKAEIREQINKLVVPLGERLDAQDRQLAEIVEVLTSRPQPPP